MTQYPRRLPEFALHLHVVRGCPSSCPGCPLPGGSVAPGAPDAWLPWPVLHSRLSLALGLLATPAPGLTADLLTLNLGPGDLLAGPYPHTPLEPLLDHLLPALRAAALDVHLFVATTGVDPRALATYEAVSRRFRTAGVPGPHIDCVLSHAMLGAPDASRRAYLERVAALEQPHHARPDDPDIVALNSNLQLMVDGAFCAGAPAHVLATRLRAAGIEQVDVTWATAHRAVSVLGVEAPRILDWVQRFADAMPHPPPTFSALCAWLRSGPVAQSHFADHQQLTPVIGYDGTLCASHEFLGDVLHPISPITPDLTASAAARLLRRSAWRLYSRPSPHPVCARCPVESACHGLGAHLLRLRMPPAPAARCPLSLEPLFARSVA